MKKDWQKRMIFPLGVFVLFFLSSCSGLKKEEVQKEQVHKQAGDVDKQAQIEIGAGRFQKAIDPWKEIYQTYPQDLNVRKGYIKTLESIKSRGDQAFEKNDFKLAGKIYGVLGRNWVHFSDFSQSLSFGDDLLEKKIKTSRCLLTEGLISSHLKAGEFRKAIDLSKEIYQKYPQDPTVRGGYIRTLESVKTSADRAFEGNDFALAGCAYEIVLRNVSSLSHLNGSFSFSKEGLTARIGDCKRILFENGLKQYRSGNLNQAISLWKSILMFDPQNQEIKKAVDLASVQVKNLRQAK